jgi:hypothetical protein
MTSEMFVLEQNPSIVVRKMQVGDKTTHPCGYCYKCSHVIMNPVKKSQLGVFEMHVCKERQHRTYGEASERVAHVPEVPKEEQRPWADFAQTLRKHVPAFKAAYITPIEKWRAENPTEEDPRFTDDDTRVALLKTLNAMSSVGNNDLEATLMRDKQFATMFGPDDFDSDDEEPEAPPPLAEQLLSYISKSQKEISVAKTQAKTLKSQLLDRDDLIQKLQAELDEKRAMIVALQKVPTFQSADDEAVPVESISELPPQQQLDQTPCN